MTWIVVRFALMTIGIVSAVFVNRLRTIDRVKKRRWFWIFWPCYALMIGSLLSLANDQALGSLRTWLPLAFVFVVLAAVAFPARSWANCKKAQYEAQRAEERDRFGFTE